MNKKNIFLCYLDWFRLNLHIFILQRKADVLENDQEQEEKSNEKEATTTKSDETPKKKTKAERKQEDKEKNERSVFVGNVPIECMQKVRKTRTWKIFD